MSDHALGVVGLIVGIVGTLIGLDRPTPGMLTRLLTRLLEGTEMSGTAHGGKRRTCCSNPSSGAESALLQRPENDS
jgi:hypothetical protein